MSLWASLGGALRLLVGLCAFRALLGAASELQLELVSVVHRHGDRSPVVTLPKDRVPESAWPQGLGQLSVLGMRQEYHLGALLRDRYVTSTYKDFLFKNYTRVQVYSRSTDVDRTLMSEESLFAALFPPEEDIFNATVEIQWQPIPVHTVASDNDKLLQAPFVDCPRYEKLREEDKKSEEYRRMEEENQGLFTLLEGLTGLETIDLSNAFNVFDTLFVENATGYGFPDWWTPTIWEQLRNVTDYGLVLFYNTLEKQRLTSGPWIDKVLSDMLDKAAGTDDVSASKLFIYSAHDTTVACMMSGLGVYDGVGPPYASAFIIELLKDQNGVYYVKYFYRNDTFSDVFVQLPVPNCDDNACPLEKFESLVKPVIPMDWEAECGLPSSGSSTSSGVDRAALALGILFGVAVIAFVVVSVVALWGCRQRQKGSVVALSGSPYNRLGHDDFESHQSTET